MAAKLGADFGPILRQLTQLGGPQVRRDLVVLFSRTALTEVRRGFNEGKAPDDAPWAPSIRVKKGLGGGGPLVDTRRLIGAFTAGTPTGTGFRVWPGRNTEWPSVQFVKVHQYGKTIVPRRAKALHFRPGGWRDKEWVYAKRAVIPARPMLPLDASGIEYMPARWERAFRTDAARVLANLIGIGGRR